MHEICFWWGGYLALFFTGSWLNPVLFFTGCGFNLTLFFTALL